MLTSLRAACWSFFASLWTGLTLLFAFRASPAGMSALSRAAPWLAVLSIATWAGYDFLQAESDRAFSISGLTTTIAACGLLIGLLALRRSSARQFDLAALAGGVAAVTAWIGVLAIAALFAWDPAIERLQIPAAMHNSVWQGLRIAAAVWFALAMWRFGRIASTESPKRIGGWLALSCLAAGTLLPSQPMVSGKSADEGHPGLLHMAAQRAAQTFAPTPTAPEQARPQRVNVEATYYRQPELMRAALDGLAPSRADRPEIYVLAAATFAGQAVFMREVQSAKSIVDERFGTAGRSMLLVNHRDTVSHVPLANVTNLAAALAGLGRVMDAEKDLLVLYITSHGSPGEIAVQFPGFSPMALTPDRLRRMLDASRIKHKLVVISACYSGSFIPALTGPNTVIMTAARPDRTSFGCSDERDWTYFGDALFNHALRATHSFTDAFEAARKLVSKWESEQKFDPSEPQLMGDAAGLAKLKEVAAYFSGQREGAPLRQEETPSPSAPVQDLVPPAPAQR